MIRRTFITIASLLLCCGAAYAQYNTISYDTECFAKLVQIDQYDESTVLFFTAASPEGRERFSVNDNIKITVDGSYKAYKLLSVANIPMSSENCVAYLKDKGNTLNFIMEFEKFPIDKPFRIIENTERSNALIFNYDNVTVADAPKEKIDINDFLSFTDYVRSGKYTKDGGTFMYYDFNGVSVATHLRDEFWGLTRVGVFDVVVTNDSGRTVVVDSNNIKVTAIKNEKNGYVEIPLWSAADFDSMVASNNNMSVSSYADNINPVASAISDYRRYRVNRDDIKGQILYGSLETVFRATSRSEVDEYAAALEKNRQRLWNNYLRGVDVESGESYGGFVAFKDQKGFKHYIITVTVGGHDYVFNIAG